MEYVHLSWRLCQVWRVHVRKIYLKSIGLLHLAKLVASVGEIQACIRLRIRIEIELEFHWSNLIG